MANIAPNLFRASALIAAISIPGHIKLGFDVVHPVIAAIPNTPNNRIAKRGAQSCWNYVNASLLIVALLNWQWSRTLGPKTMEEKVMIWTLSLAGAVSTWTYAQVGIYLPLPCLLVAPTLSLLGWRLS